MTLKAVLAATAAAAIALGLALPTSHGRHAEPRSQIFTIEIGHG
jgi:hypothetical protein